MLNEGWRKAQRGSDVVVGFVETHGRPNTAAQVRDLEEVPRRRIEYRGASIEEMDVDAILRRKPAMALVDELAHTNVPGSRNGKRWQDVEELLDAGIDVISTLNVQHLESLNDVIQRITGVVQRETVPDAVVRQAAQIELVDMSPEALRRRMAHGNIYPAERVDAALANYFRPGNLGALRELALLWVADRVEEALQSYMDAHGISDAWETRDRVVVAVTGAPGGSEVVRRAGRVAARLHGDLIGVRIVKSDGLATKAGPELDDQRRIVEELGGTYKEVVGDDVGDALVAFARAEKATQLVIGASRRSRRQDRWRGSVAGELSRRAVGFDLHVIARDAKQSGNGSHPARELPPSRPPRRAAPLAPGRQLTGWLMLVVGTPLLTLLLHLLEDHITLTTDFLAYLVLVVAIAVVGGLLPGVVAAVVTSLVVNWFFVPPIHTFTIGDTENVVAVAVFIAVAVTVATLVDRSARQAYEARRARAEAEALARTTTTLVGEADPLPGLLDQLRAAFSLDSACVLTEAKDGEWHADAASGEPPPRSPAEATASFPLDDTGTRVLAVTGPQLALDDERIVRAMASQLTVAMSKRVLMAEAEEASKLADANALRTALLQAVSHDLRTPLATIKASVTSLLQGDVSWAPAERNEFLASIDTETDRLNRLVGNLLDMSRLQSGAVDVVDRPVYLEDVVAMALASLSRTPECLEVAVPETVPAVRADPALLERAVANVVANAASWAPPGTPVRVEAGKVGDRVHLRIIDRGPGVPPADRERVFEPFQRLGDRGGTGVGLGLAVARGFVQAMGGRLTLDDTPGGGLTVVVDLAEAEAA
jgi:two-component system sensor histidine kinase KdpD